MLSPHACFFTVNLGRLFRPKLLPICPTFISAAVLKKKKNDKKQLRGKRLILAHNCRLQYVPAGKSKRELEAASHVTPKSREEQVTAFILICAYPLSTRYTVQDTNMDMVLPTMGESSSSSKKQDPQTRQ